MGVAPFAEMPVSWGGWFFALLLFTDDVITCRSDSLGMAGGICIHKHTCTHRDSQTIGT